MIIDRDLILKLEKLTKLNLSDEERNVIQKDLGEILDMVAKLEEIDLADVEPIRHMTEEINVFRADMAKPSLPRQTALNLAPAAEQNLYKVPKVLKK